MEKIRRRENRLNAHLIEILERVRLCACTLSSCYTHPVLCAHGSESWHPLDSLRWTAKATKCVERPAAFVGPSPSTKEKWELKLLKTFCLSNHLLQESCFILTQWILTFSLFQFEEMNSEMEENKELADNRLIELQKLQQDLQNVHQENNNMKVSNILKFFLRNRIIEMGLNYMKCT